MTRKQQLILIELLAELMNNGFTFQESLVFIKKLHPKMMSKINQQEMSLKKGQLLHQFFQGLGFPKIIVAQLKLAENHGDFNGTLKSLERQMAMQASQRQQGVKVLSYPLCLLLFLVIILLLMKWVLLPQLSYLHQGASQGNLGLWVIESGPWVLGGLLLLALGGYGVIHLIFRHLPVILKYQFLAKLPVFGKFIQLFLTAFFAQEWGKLLNQGLELKQVITLMKGPGSTQLMEEIAISLESHLKTGRRLHRQIKEWDFFSKELAVIIQQGEAKGKLGAELEIYSQLVTRRFNNRLLVFFNIVQPIIFMLVALLIISVYSGLLLPIYKEMDGF